MYPEKFCRHYFPPELYTPGIVQGLTTNFWVTSMPYGICDGRVPGITGIDEGKDIACVGPDHPECPHPEDVDKNLIPSWIIFPPLSP